MNLNKSTRYALYAALEMARANGSPTTVGEVASRYGISEGVLAKVFQQLVRGGVAVGTRGVGGGYRLAQPAATVTVLDVIQVFEPPRMEGQCLLLGERSECPSPSTCRLGRLFDEVEEMTRNTFQSVSLATLAGQETAAG